MPNLKATLFGKFNIQRRNLMVKEIPARKARELLTYLLIFRNHPQPRELLCEVLWANQPATTSRKKLRQTLWHLQAVLNKDGDSVEPELQIDNNWVQFNLSSDFWLDIAEFETVFDLVNEKRAQEFSAHDVEMLEHAVDVYKGDLLEGWYQEWCIFERERFQIMHLMLLDKLVQICEFHQKYEAGLSHGMEILRHDHAYERTHRQLMRLFFMTGNRTQALHQYGRCVTALQDELGVEPSERTKQLYEQIRLDSFKPALLSGQNIASGINGSSSPPNDILSHLGQFADALRRIESQVQQEIVTLEGESSRRS